MRVGVAFADAILSTVARDGDEIYLVSVMENEAMGALQIAFDSVGR